MRSVIESVTGKIGEIKRNLTSYDPSRRKFIYNAALGTVGLGLLGAGLGIGGLYTPENQPYALKEKDKLLFPGWIEADIKSEFVQLERGHFSFLQEAVRNNPILNELTKDYFSYLNTNLDKKQRIGLGDALLYAVEKAHEKLKTIDESKISSRTNLELESLHAGFFVFAAGFMTWFSTADLNELGVDLKGKKTSSGYFKSLWENVYPQLFIQEGLKTKAGNLETGQDRAVHFAQHLLLSFEYLYSRNFGLSTHESIPIDLKEYILFKSVGEYINKDQRFKREAEVFSEGLGFGWEYSNLLDGRNWPVFGPTVDDITEGPFDKGVWADYKANPLGALAGVTLFWLGLNHTSLDQLSSVIIPRIKNLNNQKYTKFETEPEF